LTVADLAATPDDGHRYELIDGAMIVSPAPAARHQRISLRLSVLLDNACPPGLLVFAAPFDVVLADDTSVQPDLVVAREADVAEANLPAAPVLAVEILSPSTRLIDLNLKRERYRRAGIWSYWIVDPDGPRLTVLELRDDAYVEVADLSGDASWTAILPYEVTIVPSQLVA